jgi:hypothetical protein
MSMDEIHTGISEDTELDTGPAIKEDLVRAMRDAATWRKRKAREFEDDKISRMRSHRAMVAIQTAAKFVESLPEDDRDLAWLRSINKSRGGRAWLCAEAGELLGRFGMDKGAWTHGPPSETQIRNLLRRVAGAQTRERAAERRDAGSMS